MTVGNVSNNFFKESAFLRASAFVFNESTFLTASDDFCVNESADCCTLFLYDSEYCINCLCAIILLTSFIS